MKRARYVGAAALAFIAAAGLIVTTLMITTADGGGGVVQPPKPVTVDTETYIEAVPNAARDVPALTEDQVADVKDILDSDTRLEAMLSGVSFTIQVMGPWVAHYDNKFIGAAVIIELESPISYEGTVPALSSSQPDERSGKLYIDSDGESIKADDIESLFISVDLNKMSIVSIQVEKAANIVYLDDLNMGWTPQLGQ